MTDLVEGYVGMAHYAEHVLPVLQAIEPERRGKLYGPRETVRELQRDGIPCEVGYGATRSTAPLIVGGTQDARYGRRPHVMSVHGAQQQYANCTRYASYAGGAGRDGIDLFLCPSQRSVDVELARYPNARAVAVGAPKLDAWAKIPNPRNGVVGVTFHWPAFLKDDDDQPIPEAGNALAEWRETIEAFAKRAKVIGTAHPRHAREMAQWWASIGVEYVPRAVDLLVRAEILVGDNTSLLPEWAALDRPVVFLRGDGWRDIHGPPRFEERTEDGTSMLPGPEVRAPGRPESVAELASACEVSRDRFVLAREAATLRTYGGPPGGASERAATAVLALMDG